MLVANLVNRDGLGFEVRPKRSRYHYALRPHRACRTGSGKAEIAESILDQVATSAALLAHGGFDRLKALTYSDDSRANSRLSRALSGSGLRFHLSTRHDTAETCTASRGRRGSFFACTCSCSTTRSIRSGSISATANDAAFARPAIPLCSVRAMKNRRSSL